MDKTLKYYVSVKAEVNESERSLVHYTSTNDVDRDNEIVLPEGIELLNYQKNPQVLYNHISWSDRVTTIGKSLYQKADGKGLLCKTQFAKTILADEVFMLYKEGFLTSWSIGFIGKEWSDSGDGLRTYTKSELLEYSAVTIPANPEALSLNFIKGLKSDELKTSFVNDYLLDRLDNEIKSLKELISNIKCEVSSKDIEALIKKEVDNNLKVLNPKIESLANDIRYFKAENTKRELESMINEVVRKKLS